MQPKLRTTLHALTSQKRRALGALYEIVEWLLTLTAPPEMAHDYNGQQGDDWDAQKDMALAFAGAIGAWTTIAIIRLIRSSGTVR